MIYIVQEGPTAVVKIGYTQDRERFQRRLHALQIGNSKPLAVLALIDGYGPSTEKRMHTIFSSKRIRGEWFRYSPGLKRLVAECQGKDFDLWDWLDKYEAAVAYYEGRFKTHKKPGSRPSNRATNARIRAMGKAERERQVEAGEITIRTLDAKPE